MTPGEVLKDLPPPLKAIDQPLQLQFNADTMTDAAELARPFFALVPSVCGLTKLIVKPSSPAAQQAATVTALTLTWEKPKARHSRPTLTVDMHSHDSCINDERQLASNGEAGSGGLSSRVTELTAISAKCSAEGHRCSNP